MSPARAAAKAMVPIVVSHRGTTWRRLEVTSEHDLKRVEEVVAQIEESHRHRCTTSLPTTAACHPHIVAFPCRSGAYRSGGGGQERRRGEMLRAL